MAIKPLVDLSFIQALVFDIDGVLCEGDRALPGAVELISHLGKTDVAYALLTNNTTRPFSGHVKRLSQLGMPVPARSIITAAKITAQTLAREAQPGARCLVIGEAGLIEALEQVGFEVTQTEHRHVEYVVVGMDRQFNYKKLKAGALAIRNGANFISTNADPVYPNGQEIIPASGAIQAALEAASGVKAIVLGKPQSPGFAMAINLLGAKPAQTGMLGDQLEADILGAKKAGLNAFLILSSVTPRYCADNAVIQPDAVFESTLDFYKQWLEQKN
jgi:4-nitrophenyl phosphatase